MIWSQGVLERPQDCYHIYCIGHRGAGLIIDWFKSYGDGKGLGGWSWGSNCEQIFQRGCFLPRKQNGLLPPIKYTQNMPVQVNEVTSSSTFWVLSISHHQYSSPNESWAKGQGTVFCISVWVGLKEAITWAETELRDWTFRLAYASRCLGVYLYMWSVRWMARCAVRILYQRPAFGDFRFHHWITMPTKIVVRCSPKQNTDSQNSD